MESLWQACSWQVFSGGNSMITKRAESCLLVVESILNKWYYYRKIGQGRHRATTRAWDHYLALNARLHRRTTVPHFALDLAAVSGRRIFRQSTDVSHRIAFTPSFQSFVSFRLHPTKRTSYCGAENISRIHHKNGGVFFSVRSRDSPDRMIAVESSSGEKMERDFLPPT
ncbi:hypothetical protein TNCV_3137791 [Trichonephila clavipes]|nr:hypothetical protein TNCV_3137791 [Trichonephila clavipes]